MKKISTILLAITLCFSLAACGNPKTTNSAESYIGTNYESVIADLTEAGFTNIETKEVQDLIATSDLQDGDVGEISINGETNFEKETEFEKDAPIIITYHTLVTHNVKVHVDFSSNLLFDKYDVTLAIGEDEHILEHGKSGDFEFNLKDGNHTLLFTNVDSESIKGEVPLDVTCDIEAAFEIKCHTDEISVKTLYIDNMTELAADEAKVMSNESDLKDENYKKVTSTLKKWGFTNITEKPVYDIDNSWTKPGSVKNVTIGKTKDYRRGDVFKKNTKIIVSYHMSKDDDPSKIKPPYDTDTADGMNYMDVVKAFEKAGFTNVSAEKTFTPATRGQKTDTVTSININDTCSFKVSNAFSPDANVEILYYVPYKSDTELKSEFAHTAFEKCGKAQFPYGFKCHWISNGIAAEQRSDGSWYFKVGVTIENAYGNKLDTIAEGIVSGTDQNPVVTQFYVNY